MFVDLFGGGFNVGINVAANGIVYNDSLQQVSKMLQMFSEFDKNKIFADIFKVIGDFNLSDSTKNTYADYECNSSEGLGKYNKEAYLKLRDEYNNQFDKDAYESIILFYVLTCYSFSNQIRFNSKGNFNMPYGKRDFNKNMQQNLDKFLDKLHSSKIRFFNKDFRKLKIDFLKPNDLVYCDPPYLITCASYNENNGWNEQDERDLLNLLDSLNNNRVKFALSNVLEEKGRSNDILKEWVKNYMVHKLDYSYSNCNYQKKDRDKNATVEVLITNY